MVQLDSEVLEMLDEIVILYESNTCEDSDREGIISVLIRRKHEDLKSMGLII